MAALASDLPLSAGYEGRFQWRTLRVGFSALASPGKSRESPQLRLGRRPLSISGKRPFRQRDCAWGNSPPSTMQVGPRRSRFLRDPPARRSWTQRRRRGRPQRSGAHVVSARVCGCALGKRAAGACPPAGRGWTLFLSVTVTDHTCLPGRRRGLQPQNSPKTCLRGNWLNFHSPSRMVAASPRPRGLYASDWRAFILPLFSDRASEDSLICAQSSCLKAVASSMQLPSRLELQRWQLGYAHTLGFGPLYASQIPFSN
jgi:hypothetical protein